MRTGANAGSDQLSPIRRTDAAISAAIQMCSQELALDNFPNDLTRMLYLASLGIATAADTFILSSLRALESKRPDHALSLCHDQIFRRLLKAPVHEYALQLEEYIRYTRAERSVVLATWRSLQAYRSTVPVNSLQVYADLFCLNIELALTILNDSRAWAEAGT